MKAPSLEQMGQAVASWVANNPDASPISPEQFQMIYDKIIKKLTAKLREKEWDAGIVEYIIKTRCG